MSKTNQIRWLSLSILVFLLDQTSKWLIHKYFVVGQSDTVLPFFNLVFSHNSGAAFGFLSLAGGWQRWFFILVAAVISAVILRLLSTMSRETNWTACAMALVLGGALGNLYDRVVYGHVTDFFDFHLNTWHFATFNVADTAICIGVGMWLLACFLKKT